MMLLLDVELVWSCVMVFEILLAIDTENGNRYTEHLLPHNAVLWG